MTTASETYLRYREIIKDRELPLAFVELEHFDRNVGYVAMTQEESGKTVRIHSKSLRCPALMNRAITLGGERFKGVMTFSMAETAWLAEQGFDDFIVAYPTVQKADMARFTALTAKGVKISLMVDSPDHIQALSKAGTKAGVVLKACMEVDVSYHPLGSGIHLGPRRSPLRRVDEAMEFARSLLKHEGVQLNAVMTYEAHIASVADAEPGAWLKNRAMRAMKKASIREIGRRRSKLVEALKSDGFEIEIVNGGGSGSLLSTGGDPSLTEVTAGSAFFAPGLFQHFKEVAFRPSAFFAIQVVRRPTPHMVTCHGGGYVASGSVGEEKLPRPVYPPGLKFLPMEGAGEVQTPLLLPDDCPELAPGDPIFFQHAKAGELCERFKELYLIRDDAIVDKVKTYRGEGQCFL